ncbi:MAG: phytanoyl-CoA dioxygenase family protein [Chitinophagales bacterium]|nr:phytanoyl-CoA dioxygenase family protein [Chitinophagales bacterium]
MSWIFSTFDEIFAMKYQPIFKSDEHQFLFEKQGFVIVPLLDEKSLIRLNNIFDDLHPNLPKEGFISGGYSQDLEYKMKSSQMIKDVMEPFVDKIFQDYKIYGSTFVYKVASKNSELGPHQDWSIVDEDVFFSLNCWVPLCDITSRNGPMYVLPGSHYLNHQIIRAPSMGYYYDNYRDVVLKYMVPLKVKAGTAIIINHSIIHYSSPNYTNKVRKALISAIKSSQADTILYYDTKCDNVLEVYQMPEDFAVRYNNFFQDNKLRPDSGKLLKEKYYIQNIYSKSEVDELFNMMHEKSGYFDSRFKLLMNKIVNRFTIV